MLMLSRNAGLPFSTCWRKTISRRSANMLTVTKGPIRCPFAWKRDGRSEEHTSELQSLMRNSYAVFCLKKKKQHLTDKLIVTITTTTNMIVLCLHHTTL